MIEQRLMKPGSFSLKLKAEAAWSKKSAIQAFDHIVVMPGQFDPVGFSDANILANAAYVGVVLKCDSKAGTFEGAGLAHWLGTAQGMGDVLDTAVTFTAGTLTQWVTALLPTSLTLGTVTNTTTLTWTAQWITRRQALDYVCSVLSAEWSISTSFVLSAGPVANLFTTTPVVVVTDKEEGQDGTLRGLDGELYQQVDVTNYGTAAIVVAQGSGSTVATAAATSGATTYRDGLGNVVVMEGLFNQPSTTSGTAAAAATAALAQISSAARTVSVASNTYNVTKFAKPGDSVYSFDLEAQLINAAQQVTYRGELITPLTQRVYALTWPVERGMAVFVRRSTGVGTFTYTDLTDAMEYETGDVSWEVGAVDPSVAPDITSVVGNIAIQGRVAGATGYVGMGSKTAPQATITVIVDLSSMTVTWTAAANRRYKLHAECYFFSSVANDIASLSIADNASTQVQSANVTCTSTSIPIKVACELVLTGLSGSVTYKCRGVRSAGTGNLTCDAGAAYPAFLLVEDIGPA